jgi:metal-responsive CopG/Arc/MetJ family transcriptional regulator
MSAVRLNITLPQELAQELDKLAGSRGKSQFIAETLREKVEMIKEEELQRSLEEGYKAGREESVSIAEEFEAVDVEGWDEY